MEDNNVMKTAL